MGPYGSSLLKKGYVLMEIKVAGALPLWLVHTLSEMGIYRTSFSKYGNAYLEKQMIENNNQERIAL